MTGPGNRVGIRNKLIANREHRGLERDYSEDGFNSLMSGVGKMTIGRFLLSKGQVRAGEDKIDNGILDVRKNLVAMNRSRGVATDIGSIMLTYQTPEEFQARILERARNDKEERRLTPKGLKQHIIEVKKDIAGTFRSQSEEASRMQDAQMRLEHQQNKELMIDTAKKDPIYADLSDVELREEFEDVIVEIGKTAPRGFKLRQNIHYEDDLVGVKIRQRDDASVALVQNDIDRVNAAYSEHGLLSEEHPEIRLEEISLFIPVFKLTINPDQAKDEMYLPIVTTTTVPFQELGIHKIQ